MRIPIPCHNKRFRLVLGITAKEPTTLILQGKDAERDHTTYVSRRLHFSIKTMKNTGGYREVRIPFPLAPKFMMFEIWDAFNPGKQSYRIKKIDVEPLEPKPIWEHPDIHSFIPFANWFSQKAGTLGTGVYDSPDRRYLIEYMPVIRDNNGIPLITPARQSRQTGRIQASKQHFVPLSIPVRWFILMHERKHFQLPTRIEKEADLAALKVFLDFGFPKVEAIYACTLAMNADSPLAKQIKTQRLKDIHTFVDAYMQSENQQSNGLKFAA